MTTPAFELRQFRQLAAAKCLREQLTEPGQRVISCGCCDREWRRPGFQSGPMKRRATVFDRRNAVYHFLAYHRDRLPAGFRIDP